MKHDDVEAILCTLPGATIRYPFEDAPWIHVYAVEGKWFAWADTNTRPRMLQAKCDPEISLSLRTSYDGIQPGYHMNKRHWISVALDANVPDALIRQVLIDAHELIVLSLPKAVRVHLLADPSED